MPNEATTVETRKVSGNTTVPSKIEFPFDEYGFTTLLRKEGVRAVGRINGDESKLSVFIQTLQVLAEYARAKIEDQAKVRERQLAAVKNRRDAEYARSIADQEAEVARLEKVLVSAKASLDAKKASPDAKEGDE